MQVLEGVSFVDQVVIYLGHRLSSLFYSDI